MSFAAKHIGCYRDTGRRAVAPLEGRSRLLRGHYRRRRYARRKCALAAQKRGYRVFAVQHGGWCASSRTGHLTYRKYGKSNRCRNGKGGPWANDVYVLRGKELEILSSIKYELILIFQAKELENVGFFHLFIYLFICKTGSCRTRTTSQHCCVFPFIYRGRRYNRCTAVNSRGRPWCAITPSYDVDKLYGYCGGRGGMRWYSGLIK